MSRLSLWSRDSLLSIASDGSVLSIGSIGSFASFGSIGSFASSLSVGSSMSQGSALSNMAQWSILSNMASGSILGNQANRAVLASRERGELQPWLPPVAVAAVGVAALAAYLSAAFRLSARPSALAVRRPLVRRVAGRLELDRRVLHVEVSGEAVLQLVEHRHQVSVVEALVVDDSMDRENRQPGRHLARMQVVHVVDVRHPHQVLAHLARAPYRRASTRAAR